MMNSFMVVAVSATITHSEEQIAQIAASIQAFGWTNPILIGGRGKTQVNSVRS